MARRRSKNPIVPLLIGGVIGGTAVLVMAPASGRETRGTINASINRILVNANDQKNNLIRKALSFADQVVRRSAGIYNKSLSYAEGTYSSSADSIELEIRSFRNALNAAVETYRNNKSGSRTETNLTGLSGEVIVNEMFTDFEDETLPKQEGMGRRQE